MQTKCVKEMIKLTSYCRCHPSYLTEKGHAKLSKPHAFDGVRIHTDEIKEVLGRLQSETLTIAVIMDSMDWFDTDGIEARRVCISHLASSTNF